MQHCASLYLLYLDWQYLNTKLVRPNFCYFV